MDPITGSIAAVGVITQLFGGIMGLKSGLQEANVAQQEAAVSQQITGYEEQENQQRQLAMQISARRQTVEITRMTQLKRAQGLAAGVNQGGQFGSGVAGGQAQAQGEGEFNLLGTNQNLQTGNNLFGLQALVSGKQIQMSGLQSIMAGLQGQQSMYAGISSLGGSLARSAGPMGNILGNFFGNQDDLSQVLPGGAPYGQGGIGHA